MLAKPLIAKSSIDNCKPLNPCDEFSDQQETIQQFDPLGNSTSVYYHSPFHENTQIDHTNERPSPNLENPFPFSSNTNESH